MSKRNSSSSRYDLDPRLAAYLKAIGELRKGNYQVEVPLLPVDDLSCLGESIVELGNELQVKERQTERIREITLSINAGLLLEDVLEKIFRDFREILPYDRIGLSLLEEAGTMVRAYWAKSELPEMLLSQGYSAPLANSSLERILKNGQPRIINDLLEYLREHPNSHSTLLIVSEGIRSSLTCPLIVNGVPTGFLFFSSSKPNCYEGAHVDLYLQVADQVSLIVEKGRLASELATQKEVLEKRNEELQKLNDLKVKFLGMAAHDLRGPISQLKLGLDVLNQPSTWSSSEERESFLQSFFSTLDEQTSYMLNLLNELLDISQIESGKLQLRFETVDLQAFLKHIVQLQFQVAQGKDIRLELQEVPAGKLVVDPRRLRQAVDNLISNALKFSPAGSTVQVGVEHLTGEWKFRIRDQGPGFTESDLKSLFQDFSRLSATPTGEEKSTGLGLAISRRVVEAHGGKIGVDATRDKGSTLWFTLPD